MNGTESAAIQAGALNEPTAQNQPTARGRADGDAAADVLVIGGGIIGLAIAWRAAQRGLQVVLADPAPGQGATHAAAGMLTPVAEAAYAERELFTLGSESLGRYPAFTAELTRLTGLPTGFRATGTLQVAYDSDDLAVLAEARLLQESLGRPASSLTARECRDAEPMLDPSVRGGLLAAGDGSVDPRLLATALLAAARQAGVRLIAQRATTVLTTTVPTTTVPTTTVPTTTVPTAAGHGAAQERVTGARLADGTVVSAPWVVLAAGWQSAALDGLPPGTLPPVRPVKGQILRLRPAASAWPALTGPAPTGQAPAGPGPAGPGPAEPGPAGPGPAGSGPALLSRTVRGVVRGSSVYLVPRQDGEIVVGATQEELGADTTVTAGGVWQLLRDARLLVPGITELELAEAVAGLRPGTPDNAPVLGPGALPGLVLATGHFRGGVLLAPVTADLTAEYLETQRLPALALPFAADRFRRPGRSVPDRYQAAAGTGR